MCSFGEALGRLRQKALSAQDGWQLVTENNKTGLLASTPGSDVALHLFRGRSMANATLYLTYLRSYTTSMGIAQLTCAGACTCVPATFDAFRPETSHSLSYTGAPVLLNVSGDGDVNGKRACSVRLRVLNATRSGGHKFKLLAVTVVPPELSARKAGGLGLNRVKQLQNEIEKLSTAEFGLGGVGK